MGDLSRKLTGRSSDHLVEASYGDHTFLIHPEAKAAFLRLHQAAKIAGFDLRPCSIHRTFERQLSIWNRKMRDELPILDSQGTPLKTNHLPALERVHAILRWSALPGASRHHWGTDLDVFDAQAVAKDYSVQLTPSEVERGGPFYPLHTWLDGELVRHGFFRPYASDRGGVAPERWHLSYRPLAEDYLAQFRLEWVEEALTASDIEAKQTLLNHLPDLLDRYLFNVAT